MEYWSREKYFQDYDKRERILLGKGEYKGYKWFIVSYCTHHCAYIVVELGDYGYKTDEWEFDELYVHGGVTYSQWGLHEWVDQNEWVIGWDYHDYSSMTGDDGVKYTTGQVYEDVKDAINQLRDMS